MVDLPLTLIDLRERQEKVLAIYSPFKEPDNGISSRAPFGDQAPRFLGERSVAERLALGAWAATIVH